MTKELLSPEMLRKLLRYDPDTGKLFWIKRDPSFFKAGKQTAMHNCAAWNARYADTEAFTSIRDGGYKHGQIFSKSYKAHRIAWALHYGEWPKECIDHINGVTSDNRIKNLRDVSRSKNQRNASMSLNNTSGVCGVYWCKRSKKWIARIEVQNARKYLGSFQSIQDASAARRAAEMKHGFTERHGKQSTTPETQPRRT